MRDLVLLASLLAVTPLMFRAPIVGLLAWIWIALMNPQREVYGFLSGMGLNLIIAALTAVAWLVSREGKRLPLNGVALLLILFGAWTCVTTAGALDTAFSAKLLDRTLKTIALALAVFALANTRERLQAVVWMVVASLGYYAVKGGGFVLLTAGRQHVYGPENSMIADNNNLALALIAILPLLAHLRATSAHRFTRWGCVVIMMADVVAILGTYSRGALVTLAAAAAVYAVRSRSGIVVLALGAVIALGAPSVLPANWMSRMSTIQSYDQDASFNGRVAAWRTSLNIVQARPLTGGGFSAVELDQTARQFHSPGSLEFGRAAHSIYFEVLGDHGLVGLALYLAILVFAGINTVHVLVLARGRADLAWARSLARMMQVSLVAVMVGGAALSMAYYDGFIIIMALTGALVHVVRRPALEAAPSVQQPRWRQLAEAA